MPVLERLAVIAAVNRCATQNQSCPMSFSATSELVPFPGSSGKIKVKGSGQECPLHTAYWFV
jgi:hypothetical protein